MLVALVVLFSLQTARSVGTAARRASLIRHEISPEGLARLQTDKPVKAESVQIPSRGSLKTGCSDCCNNGQDNVPCTDVEECAEMAPKTGKYALILSYVGRMDSEALPFLQSAKAAAELANKAPSLQTKVAKK